MLADLGKIKFARTISTHIKNTKSQFESKHMQTLQKQKTRISTGLEAGYFTELQILEEREGFEPSVRSHARLISSQVHSTTLPPLLIGSITALECSEGKEYIRVFCNGKPHPWTTEIQIPNQILNSRAPLL